MTVSSTVRKAGPFAGNGVTIVFPFSFKIFAAADLYAVRADAAGAETVLTLTTDYTVALNADQNASPGGSVAMLTAPATGQTLTLGSVMQNTQPTDITNNGGFYPNIVEDALDRGTIQLQQLDEKVSRSLKMAISTPAGVTSQLPAPVPYALIGWNGAGNGFQNTDPTYSTALATDLASIASGKGAALVGIHDALNMYPSASVEEALQDLATKNSAAKGAAIVGFYDSLAPAYLKTLSDIANGDEVSLFRFISPTKHAGIRAETNADDLLTSFQDAAAAAKCLVVPYGKYNVSGTTTISKDGAKWRGEGMGATKIVSSVAALPLFSIAGSLTGVSIEDLQLDRSVIALVGGDGITCSTVTTSQALIRNVLTKNQFNGLSLGPTDYSLLQNIIAQTCQGDGVSIINTAGLGTLQWSIDRLLAQKNAGRGLIVSTIAGPSTISLGTWRDINTFANSGFGVAVVGAVGRAIFGMRWSIGFSGENGNSAVYLDTYGEGHRISAVQTELSGNIATGPTLSTPASNTGNGFEATGNNIGVMLSDCDANGHAQDGYYLGATVNVLDGCKGTNNGLSLTAGRRNGVNHTNGRLTVTGGQYCNTQASTSQINGILAANGDNLTVVGADLQGNATAPVACTTNYVFATLVGNRPNSMDVGLSPAGQVLLGGGTTGGYKSAGTINVAGGLFKQNVAYTNP